MLFLKTFANFFSEIVCARQKKIFTIIVWKTVIAQRTIYVTFMSIVKSKYVFTYNAILSYLFAELWFQLFSNCVKDQSTLTSIPTSTPKVYKLRGELFSWNIIWDLSWFWAGYIDKLEFMNFLYFLHLFQFKINKRGKNYVLNRYTPRCQINV